MKVPSFPRFNINDGNFTPAGLDKLNNMAQVTESILRNLDYGNNFKGNTQVLTLRNGIPVTVPLQGSFVAFLGEVPSNGNYEKPTRNWRAVNGGLEVVVVWEGSATTIAASIFIGVV